MKTSSILMIGGMAAVGVGIAVILIRSRPAAVAVPVYRPLPAPGVTPYIPLIGTGISSIGDIFKSMFGGSSTPAPVDYTDLNAILSSDS